MLFSREKDDDDDFIPNPNYNSNLASLFSGSGSGANSSLTYTAPKQPKRQSKTTSRSVASSGASSNNSVLIARIVQAFKMVDGVYQNQGKLGAALLSINSEEATAYQMLLYRDKKHHLCTSKVTRDFNFHIQPKNYCTFYDKQNVIWSILFESTVELVDFAVQIALARWRAGEPTTPLMTQDLWCPVSDYSSCVTEAGDNVELTYTLHTLNSASQGMEESLSVWVEVEKTGWKQTLIGLQPRAQRVVILQPFMLGDLNPKEVVYNCPIVVKMTVVQVSKAAKELPPDPPKGCSPPLRAERETVSDTDVKASQSPSKADLISRMARMGQALPFKTAGPTPSDSDETEEDVRGHLHSVAPKPRSRTQHSPPAAMGVAAAPSLTSPVALTTHQMTATPFMVSSIYQAPQLDAQSQFQMFFSEVRTTNSELRMGITRLTDKVEALQSKIDNSATDKPNPEIPPVIERLLQNEQQLREQLQQLLTGLQHSQSFNENRVLPSNESSSSGAELCQKCAKCSDPTLSEKFEKLKLENEYLRTSISAQKEALQNARIADQDQMAQMSDLQKQLDEKQHSVHELNERLRKLQLEKESLNTNLEIANQSIANLQAIVVEKQTNIDRLEQTLRDSEDTKLEEVRQSLQEVLDPRPKIADHVKKILNAVYRLVKVQFEPKTMYEAPFIQSVLADTIKAVTIEYLENGELLTGEQLQSMSQDLHPGSIPGFTTSITTRKPIDEDRTDYEGEQRSDQQNSSKKDGILTTVNIDKCENNNVEDNSSIVHNNKVRDEGNVGRSESLSSISPSAHESSHDVLRPQPPPPPLFNADDNDDDWLNT